MNNPYDIFKEKVSDHPILFECYISLIEKMGDVIWDGYGGVDGLDNERTEEIKEYWKVLELSLVEQFKSILETIELVKEHEPYREVEID